MIDYNRKLLSKEEFLSIQPFILEAFKEFTPRSNFIKKNKSIELHNYNALDVTEQPNLLSFPTTYAPHHLENVLSFHEVFCNVPLYNLINEKLQAINNYVSENVLRVKNSFITFSTNITGAKIGVKHLHSLLNGDHCNVWSFAIPLYIDTNTEDSAGFWYNSQENLFPPRYYLDYERIKKLDIQYNSFKLPKDGKVLSIMFDGSRSPHYIDYTNHLYVFMVFDGVEFSNNLILGKKFITELL